MSNPTAEPTIEEIGAFLDAFGKAVSDAYVGYWTKVGEAFAAAFPPAVEGDDQ